MQVAMETSQNLQLPFFQYTKLLKYKDTLGCSTDAELIGLLTQTFLYTLAQPLSISSKEVDLLLSQGQGEPKIRHIMMALLIQCLSTQRELPKAEPQLLRSHSPLLNQNVSSQLSPFKNIGLGNNSPDTFCKSEQFQMKPFPLLSTSTPLLNFKSQRKSSFTTYSSSPLCSSLPTHLKQENPSSLSSETSTSTPLLSNCTPWLMNSTPLEPSPTAPLHVSTPVISLNSILSTPPIRSPDGKSILIPVDTSMFRKNEPQHYTPNSVCTPTKKTSRTRNLYQSEMPISPLVTVLDDSLLMKKCSSPPQTSPSPPLDVGTDDMSDDLAVQGPTSNVSMSEMTASELSGMSSPVSSLERNSPVSSLPDTNGVDLNEVLKALSSENGSSDSNDEVVNKLVSIINDLVETTEISMEDIIEMMKSSVESQELVMATSQTDILQPATPSSAPTSVAHLASTGDYVPFVTTTADLMTSAGAGGSGPVFGEQGFPGVVLPTSWMQLNMNAITANNLKLSPALRAPNSYHPYNKQTRWKSSNSSDVKPQTPDDKKSNVCTTCNTSFSQFSSLLRHIRQVHQKIKDKPCTICGERFARSQYLPNHIWRTHYNRATSNVKCFFCPEILCTKEGIQQHLWLNHVKARR